VSASVDLEVARWLADHRSDPLTQVCRALEDLGTSPAFFLVVGLIGLAVVAALRLWGGLPRVMAALFVAVLVCGQLKQLIDRPRPAADLALTMLSGPSMPSSHAVFTSAAVTGVLLAPWWTSARLHRLAAVVGMTGCVISGTAMIYLGGHWLSDVLIGWLLGAGIAFAVARIRLPRRRLQAA
jgi:membrane-associated phospholipid phosphatase